MACRRDRVRILSGFRAPYYNDKIVAEGAASASRHQYGDAADVIIDANGDGRMDDLNHDGRLDLSDTQVILRVGRAGGEGVSGARWGTGSLSRDGSQWTVCTH